MEKTMAGINNTPAVEEQMGAPAVGAEQIAQWNYALQRYKAGKAKLERRIVNSEQWWKLRNAEQEEAESNVANKGFRSTSGWLHNVIASKHADGTEAYPDPVFLPREKADEAESQTLDSVVPVILKLNKFPHVWSDAWWAKLKYGTAIYKTVWDANKLGGLGDIHISLVSVLNLFWEPGITDIQQSKMVFHTELVEIEAVEAMYPAAKDRLKGTGFLATKFLYDDTVSTDGKVTVVEVYYRKGGVLHYAKYASDIVLYATENDPKLAKKGLYDHGKYPYVFDTLFPIEGSPCGYGFVDVCRNPQTEIDMLNTAILRNAVASATPRFFVRSGSAVNIEDLLDLTRPIVETQGQVGREYIQPIETTPLQGNHLSVLEGKIQELRQTSGNTESATGSAPGGGVTAASAIAALQEASGKGSRDMIRVSYEAFGEVMGLCVELIRQFYDAPRKFRIIGKMGEQRFTTFDNAGLRPVSMGVDAAGNELWRKPEFDIEVTAQKQNVYTTLANNEMALQFFKLGFFEPQRVDQTLMCLEMMDFRGKEETMQKVAQMGTMADKLQLLVSYAATLARKYGDGMALRQIAGIAGMDTGAMQMPSPAANLEAAAGGGAETKEHAFVEKSREQARQATQPEGGV